MEDSEFPLLRVAVKGRRRGKAIVHNDVKLEVVGETFKQLVQIVRYPFLPSDKLMGCLSGEPLPLLVPNQAEIIKKLCKEAILDTQKAV